MEIILELTFRKEIPAEDERHPETIRVEERDIVSKAVEPLLQLGWKIANNQSRIVR